MTLVLGHQKFTMINPLPFVLEFYHGKLPLTSDSGTVVYLLYSPISHGLYYKYICEDAARGRSVYKSDTNRMGVLQLLCSIVREQIKGAPMYAAFVQY